jgi:hypothetical protein
MQSVVRFALAWMMLIASLAWSQGVGSFASAGGLITPRFGHTATLLADDRVLIAGGNTTCYVGGPCLTADIAEIYDPATGAFAATGSMSPAVRRIGGILLPDGRVFFASDSNSAGWGTLATIELYDPAAGTFGITGKTATLTVLTTATLLKDGRVLVAGYAGSNSVSSAEIYDPVPGTSTPLLNGLADAPIAAIALADGRVLFQFYEDDAKIYDPTSGSVTDAGGLCCFDGAPQASILLNGNALFSGGNDIGGSEISVELYDPTLARFAPPLKMSIARDGHNSTLLPDGTVLLAGGLVFANRSQPAVASAEIYNPATGTFSETGFLATGRADHAAVLLNDGRVLITGGSTFLGSGLPTVNPINGMSSAEIYTPTVLTPPAALLSISGDGTGQGAVQHAATYQLVTADNPAVAGEVLAVYCTGLIDGSVIPPMVAIGGRAAEVLWFGTVPGYSGLNQINVRVPSGIAASPAVPVRMNYIGRPSNAVTIGVGQ